MQFPQRTPLAGQGVRLRRATVRVHVIATERTATSSLHLAGFGSDDAVAADGGDGASGGTEGAEVEDAEFEVADGEGRGLEGEFGAEGRNVGCYCRGGDVGRGVVGKVERWGDGGGEEK